jgi:hypothetical protein
MRCARNHSAFAAVTLGVLAFFTPSLMASQTTGWSVTVSVNAVVDHGDNTAAAPVVMGGKVVDGDRLTTGSGGALVLSRGEDLVTMAENSRIVIVNPQPSGATLIDQPYGNVDYHVTKEVRPHFEVDTPLLATIVKGTTFSVAAGPSQNAVTVSEGRVVAKNRSTGASASVGAGQMGAVGNSAKNVNVGAAPAKGAGAAGNPAGASPNSNKTKGNKSKSNSDAGGKKGGGHGDGSGHSGGGHGDGNDNGKTSKNKGDGGDHGHGHGGN